MRQNRQQHQAIITILNRIYGEIREAEAPHGLLVGGNDYRPRIEYFHDAVRALSSGDAGVFDERGRLSVEYLAYDLSMLRHIKAAPLTPLNRQSSLSPSTQMVPMGAAGDPRRADRQLREQLSELYKHYAVLFAALFAETAEINYHSRLEDNNAQVEALAQMEALLKGVEQGKASEQELEQAAHHIDDPALRKKILRAVEQKRAGRKLETQDARTAIKGAMTATDAIINTVEKAHFTYATSQLAVYEDAKDVVKKLAREGMNIAGDFVQSAVSEAARHSRGR